MFTLEKSKFTSCVDIFKSLPNKYFELFTRMVELIEIYAEFNETYSY